MYKRQACLEKAEVVREGTDCVVFTYSRMRWTVMQAVSQLEKEVLPQPGILYLTCNKQS